MEEISKELSKENRNHLRVKVEEVREISCNCKYNDLNVEVLIAESMGSLEYKLTKFKNDLWYNKTIKDIEITSIVDKSTGKQNYIARIKYLER